MAGLFDSRHQSDSGGVQRLSVDKLKAWQQLEYGIFIHFGSATYNQDYANCTPADYAPPCKPDTDQWARVARDAGMKYAIFTTQHTCSFCHWHSDVSGVYDVRKSAEKTDLVASFVASCHKYGILPALYYSQSRFNDWSDDAGYGLAAHQQYFPQSALEKVKNQLTELLTRYGSIAEVWIDAPTKYGAAGRQEIYDHVTGLQPDTVFTYNSWGEDIIRQPVLHFSGWPTDVLTLEVLLPPYGQISPWRELKFELGKGATNVKKIYLPVECCTVMHRGGVDWFYDPESKLIGDDDLLGMRLICRARNANLVLNVAPGPDTLISEDQIGALQRLRQRLESLNA